MKRIFIIALSVLLLLSLFGCGSKSAKISSVDDLPGKP